MAANPGSPCGCKLLGAPTPGVATSRWGWRRCFAAGRRAPPSVTTPARPPSATEKGADVAQFRGRRGGVHPKAPGENKNGAEKLAPVLGGEDGDGGSVWTDSGQRENLQVCRKITSFPVPKALPCDSCFLGDSKMPGVTQWKQITLGIACCLAGPSSQSVLGP